MYVAIEESNVDGPRALTQGVCVTIITVSAVLVSFLAIAMPTVLGIYLIDQHKTVNELYSKYADTGTVVGETGDRGADGVNGVDGVDGVKGDSGADGVNGVDGVDTTHNGTDGVNGVNGTVDREIPYSIAYSEPCNCTTDTNATDACVSGHLWMSTYHYIEYTCNTAYGQWWSTELHTESGERSDGSNCGNAQTPSMNNACAISFGSGVGPAFSVLGTHFHTNWTITSVMFADDGSADFFCSGGADSYDIQLWTSSAPAGANFTLTNTLVSQSTSSRAVHTGLNIPVDGDRFVVLGIANNCGNDLPKFVMTIRYHLNPYSYVSA